MAYRRLTARRQASPGGTISENAAPRPEFARNLDAAAIHFGDAGRDRKPKTRAAIGVRPGADEPLENASRVARRHARPFVHDIDTATTQSNFDSAAMRRVGKRILDQIAQRKRQKVVIAAHDKGAKPRRR